MRDGWARKSLKWVARRLAEAELRLRRARRPGRYLVSGTCHGCGKCCEQPAIELGAWSFHVRTVRRAVAWWHRVVNGFELTGVEARVRLLVFRCTHYDPATKQCDSYDSRPAMCRDYPANQGFEAVPYLFPECSYRVVDRQARQLKAALVAAGLSGEKLAEVSRRLFLDDDAGPG